MDAGERLVALLGEEGASSRAITLGAGQRHNSAISYHFGSRRALFDAVWTRGSGAVNVWRHELLREYGPQPTLEQLVHVYIAPIAAYVAGRSPSYWARFNEESLRRYPFVVAPYLRATLEDKGAESPLLTLADVLERMAALTCDGSPVGAVRVSSVVRMVVGSLAAWERDHDRRAEVLTATDLGRELEVGALAFLRAPSASDVPSVSHDESAGDLTTDRSSP